MSNPLHISIQLLVLSLGCALVQVTPCGDYHGTPMHIHTDKTGTRRCCVRRECSQGTHGVLCQEGRPQTTECQSCSEDGYMPNRAYSDIIMSCILKTICHASDGLVVRHNGSTTEDRECQCDLSNGYFTHVSTFTTFCEFRTCPLGHQLNTNGDCDPCEPGTFKNSEQVHQCIRWINCGALGLRLIQYGNSTHDSICENHTAIFASTIGPHIGGSADSDQVSYWSVVLPMLFALLLVFLVVLIYICLKRQSGQASDSQGTSAEKQTLGREVSFSDTEEMDNRNNQKGPKDLTIQIPTAPIQESGDQYPKSSTTPDSGIVSDLKLNGNGYGPVFSSSPIFGPTKLVECDSMPNMDSKDSPPITTTPSFPQRPQNSNLEGTYKDIPLSEGHDKSPPRYLVIQSEGPVFLQYGNHNQLSAPNNTSSEQEPSVEYELDENVVPSFHTTV